VTDLCSLVALLIGGRIVANDTPAALIAALAGKVWSRSIDKAELPAYRAKHELIATRLRSGRTQIHVLADAAPDPSFEPVTSNLEDVYFATLHRQRRAA
jgi:hypothetical protein